MNDQERIERLEFLLKSAEAMVDTHLQARLRAEEALEGLGRERTHEELRWRVEQLEAQLQHCRVAVEGGREADPRFADLREYDYIYSPALRGILALRDSLQRLQAERTEYYFQTQVLKEQLRVADLLHLEKYNTPEAKAAARSLFNGDPGAGFQSLAPPAPGDSQESGCQNCSCSNGCKSSECDK